jgi:hypothetical protein
VPGWLALASLAGRNCHQTPAKEEEAGSAVDAAGVKMFLPVFVKLCEKSHIDNKSHGNNFAIAG